ncbi:MAG: hypothetical protein GXZ13_05330 [Synergistaceae bacterium]|nr:hypothetical protein [Synergistaceae bacterium]
MMYFLLIWLIQNLLQTFAIGLCLVPDFFLMSIIYAALIEESNREKHIKLIWVAFIGGIFWDLRWTNLPGLTAAINGAMVAFSSFFWSKMPAQGRSPVTFSILLAATQIISRLINVLFWTVPSQVAIRQIIVQSLLTIPVIVILAFFYHKARDSHV